MSTAGSPETEHTRRPRSSGLLHWLQIGKRANWSGERKIRLYVLHIMCKLYCGLKRSLCVCACLSLLPVVGANQNHLGALLCENSQTNLGHQVAEVCSINQPLGSCHRQNECRHNVRQHVCCVLVPCSERLPFWCKPTQSVAHGGDCASIQVQGVCEVRQHHGQVRAPVTPLLLSAALYEYKQYFN